MATQFVTNDKGEKTAVIIPIAEYENLLHQQHLNLELSDEYKTMMDKMLQQEDDGTAKYSSLDEIIAIFKN